MTPLKETVEIAETVARGDFTHRQTVTRIDELDALQASMQRMTLNLRGLVSELRDGVVQVASAAEQLSVVTEQTSAGVQTQKSETEQIATAIQQMNATIHEVARNAGQATASALQASQQASQGDQAVDKVVVQIERLAEEMPAAQNVKTLRSSTDEITQLIAALNQSNDHMGNVLEQNVQLTDDSVGLSQEVGQMLKRIVGSIKDIMVSMPLGIGLLAVGPLAGLPARWKMFNWFVNVTISMTFMVSIMFAIAAVSFELPLSKPGHTAFLLSG